MKSEAVVVKNLTHPLQAKGEENMPSAVLRTATLYPRGKQPLSGKGSVSGTTVRESGERGCPARGSEGEASSPCRVSQKQA